MSARRPRRQRGFTLLELTIALTLLALLSSVLYGALGFAGRSWEGGEAKVESTSSMRLTHGFLRAQLESQHPLRMRKIPEFPLLFTGTREELRFAAALPARVTGGGIWYYRLAIVADNDRSRLVLERIVPDLDASAVPEFANLEPADRSVLAEDIAEVRIEYFGRDPGAPSAVNLPTWRDRWDDKQRLPLAIRIEVVPKKEPLWPLLYIEPRQAPESGCRQWDSAGERCTGMA